MLCKFCWLSTQVVFYNETSYIEVCFPFGWPHSWHVCSAPEAIIYYFYTWNLHEFVNAIVDVMWWSLLCSRAEQWFYVWYVRVLNDQMWSFPMWTNCLLCVCLFLLLFLIWFVYWFYLVCVCVCVFIVY